MYDWNEAVRSLNVGLPDDIARLKAAGYYQEAIARIDRLLAEDWTKTQNGPASNGIAPPEGYVPPENPTPHGVDTLREALTVQKEIMRRLPGNTAGRRPGHRRMQDHRFTDLRSSTGRRTGGSWKGTSWTGFCSLDGSQAIARMLKDREPHAPRCGRPAGGPDRPEGDHAPTARGILLDGSRGHRPDAGAGQGLHGRGI